jgi:hypothetical protein
MNAFNTAGAVSAAALLLGLAGCGEMSHEVPPLGAPPPEEVDVVVMVVATGRCALNLPVAVNACYGVGRTDGLACGRDGDTVRWTPGNRNTTIRSISFPEGNAVVCDGGVTADGDDRVCRLNHQPGATPGKGFAFKYTIGFGFNDTECAEQDPYVIVTIR